LLLDDDELRSGTTVAMMRAAVALLLSVTLLGCFPHNPKARTYAKVGEGTALLAGIAISAFANTSADCDEMQMPGVDDSGCHSKAKWLGTAGIVLVVGGLLGFVATVSTAEDEAKPKPVEIKDESVQPAAEKVTPPPGLKPNAGAAATTPAASDDPNAAGSASTKPSSPQR
jgi:hypothetical protein